MKLLLPASLGLAAAALLAPAAVSAQVPPRIGGLNLVVGGVNVPVSEDEVRSWSGAVTLRPAAPLSAPPLDARAARAAYAGAAPQNLRAPAPAKTYPYSPGRIYGYVSALAAGNEISGADAALKIEGGRAVEFNPGRGGVSVDRSGAVRAILGGFESGSATVTVPTAPGAPHLLLSQTNDLGIRELVAQGTSSFRGSPSNRRHNIRVGVEQMRGVLIAPGAEFSFNKFLGPVDGEHGFLPELVIKKTGTVPEFGGGLCQVSSTMFRGAINAGLPITQRRNHAYAVQYYAPQGTDATIYPGVVDLKYKNDTPGYLMIWPHIEATDQLVFDLWGTKDARTVDVQKPVQYDRKSDGSMKASWTTVVSKNGTTSTSTFLSVYQSPALFHKTEEFPTATTGANGLLQFTPQVKVN